jgi:thiamine-monophosphate kinase
MGNRNLEHRFIAPFAETSRRIGDDGAVIGGQVFSKDAFVEGTHFLRRWLTPAQIAYKAVAVNVSDAVAMNAVPRQILLAVGMPRHYTAREAEELGRGLLDAARAFGCEIVGGDTYADTKISISVTVVSEVERPLLRRGIREGDLLAYTGSVGAAAKELRYLLAGGKVHARSRFVRPQLRAAFVADAAAALHAGMDISDGIYTDLARLAAANRLGFRMLSPLKKACGCSGEEYEMLVAFAPRMRKKLLRIARRRRTPLTIFAKAVRSGYRDPCRAHHF